MTFYSKSHTVSGSDFPRFRLADLSSRSLEYLEEFLVPEFSSDRAVARDSPRCYLRAAGSGDRLWYNRWRWRWRPWRTRRRELGIRGRGWAIARRRRVRGWIVRRRRRVWGWAIAGRRRVQGWAIIARRRREEEEVGFQLSRLRKLRVVSSSPSTEIFVNFYKANIK